MWRNEIRSTSENALAFSTHRLYLLYAAVGENWSQNLRPTRTEEQTVSACQANLTFINRNPSQKHFFCRMYLYFVSKNKCSMCALAEGKTTNNSARKYMRDEETPLRFPNIFFHCVFNTWAHRIRMDFFTYSREEAHTTRTVAYVYPEYDFTSYVQCKCVIFVYFTIFNTQLLTVHCASFSFVLFLYR